MTNQRKVFEVFNVLFLILLSISVLIPFMMVISSSISPESNVIKNGFVLIPKEIDLSAYKAVFFDKDNNVVSGLINSFLITGIGCFLSVLVTAMLAYPLSKTYLPYGRIIGFMVYFTMVFTGGFIPLYLVVKGVGLMNSIWSVILPLLVTPWYMILLRNFFASLPESIEESARIDGASHMRILFSIILPLSLPGLATITLFYAVMYWNQWFYPLLFISDKGKWPIQVILRNMITAAQGASQNMDISSKDVFIPAETLKMATVIITIFPIMCLYPFLQKHFAKGILIGAVKS